MIHLTRLVNVSSFDAQATVAVGRRRPELLAVARLAADLGRPINGRDVARELLGPLPEVLGWRVIERCVALRLLERVDKSDEAALSEAGRVALEHREVLAPEEAIWRFFFADDPLLPARLLHAQRLVASPVQDERRDLKEARASGERRPLTEPPPALLRSCSLALPHPSVQSGQLLQLVELPDRGATGPAGELRLALTWRDEPSLRLTGSLPGDEAAGSGRRIDVEVAIPPVMTGLHRDDLWRALVARATGVPESRLEWWQTTAGKPVVPVPFASLPDPARNSFLHDLEIPTSAPMGLGRFEPTVLRGVEVVPSSEPDAQAWLGWLQWEAINDYVTPAFLDEQSQHHLRRFPHHQPRALTAHELLARARAERGAHAWFLLAPSDLGLWS